VEIDHGNGSLTLGAELRVHRSTHWGKIQFAEGLPSNFDPDYHFYEYNGEKDIFSVYAHELFKLQDDLTLMADLQLVRNRYGIRNEKYLNNAFSLPYFFANPRVGLNYNMDDRWSCYVSLAYTSREPRLRNLYAAEDSYFGATPQFRADASSGLVRYDFDNPLAKPEHLFDAELGARFRTDETSFSANVYWMEFADELVKSGQVDIFGQPVTGNAERTRHFGLELEGSTVFLRDFQLSGNLTLSSNELVRHTVFVGVADTSGNTIYVPKSLDGNPIAGFPDVLGNLRLSYRANGFYGSILGKYVGSFYTDNFKDEANKNESYLVWNADAQYRFPKALGVELSLRGEVRNIFNRLYFMSGEGNAFFPAAERNYLVGVSVTL
jgi:iron complex outermembrane receptor protein